MAGYQALTAEQFQAARMEIAKGSEGAVQAASAAARARFFTRSQRAELADVGRRIFCKAMSCPQ